MPTLRQLFDQPDEKHEGVVEEVIDECSLNLFTAAPRLASQRQVGVSLIKWRLVARSLATTENTIRAFGAIDSMTARTPLLIDASSFGDRRATGGEPVSTRTDIHAPIFDRCRCYRLSNVERL